MKGREWGAIGCGCGEGWGELGLFLKSGCWFLAVGFWLCFFIFCPMHFGASEPTIIYRGLPVVRFDVLGCISH